MKKRILIAVVCIAAGIVIWSFAPIVIPLADPTPSQCSHMTTKALFTTVLQATETTNLAYVDSWPEFLEKASNRYYPLRVLETREDAANVISAYIQETDGNDNFDPAALESGMLIKPHNSKTACIKLIQAVFYINSSLFTLISSLK